MGDCLDVQLRQKDSSCLWVAQFRGLCKSPGKSGLYMGKQAAWMNVLLSALDCGYDSRQAA